MATHPTSDAQVLAGRPFPLGAHPEAGGVRFAVASSVADRVELCLVDDEGDERRIELTERTFGVWHGLVPGVTPGQKYGFRVHGPYDPKTGLRCNPHKLLVDPYARRISGTMTDMSQAYGYADDPDGEPSTVSSNGISGFVPVSGPPRSTRSAACR
jgi:isoamylase